MFYLKIDNFGRIIIEKFSKTSKILKMSAKIKNSKVEDLIIEVEKNGFQILVRHENLHKIGHVNENYGKNGTTCPPSIYKSENYGVFGIDRGHVSYFFIHIPYFMENFMPNKNLKSVFLYLYY